MNFIAFRLNIVFTAQGLLFVVYGVGRIIGLIQQLAKIDIYPLSTTHSALNLGFIFVEHLTFSDKRSCYSHVNFAVYAHTVIFKTANIMVTVGLASHWPCAQTQSWYTHLW